MKDFLLVFRNDFNAMPSGTQEEMQAVTQRWVDWIAGIAAQNKLTSRGASLKSGGKVVRPDNVITDGPYAELKEVLGGYTIVKASSLDEAIELVHSCPILESGGNVEIRELNVM